MTTTSSSLRIGDAERDTTVELLTRHFAEGRLTKLEHEERTAAALTATTQPALDALLADLPDLRQPARAAGRPTRPSAWPPLGLVRLALLAFLVLFVVAHAVPVLAVVAVLFLVSRLAFGRGRPSWRGGRYGPR